MAQVGDKFNPGEKVPHSGIYKVVHFPAHTQEHEVICIFGESFPPCRACDHPRFVLLRRAQHIASDELFQPG